MRRLAARPIFEGEGLVDGVEGGCEGLVDGARESVGAVGRGRSRAWQVMLEEDAGTGSAGTAVRTGSRSARAPSRTRLSTTSPPTASFGPCLTRRSDMQPIIARSELIAVLA